MSRSYVLDRLVVYWIITRGILNYSRGGGYQEDEIYHVRIIATARKALPVRIAACATTRSV